MESLNIKTSSTDTVNEAAAKPAAREPEIERVKLGRLESQKVTAWLKQLDETSKGFLQLTKSDLVNFLIRERRDELGAKEITQIRALHYDPIRHLNWITPRLKDALTSGDAEQIKSIQEDIRSIELSVIAKVTDPGGATLPSIESKQKRPRSKKTPAIQQLSHDAKPLPRGDLKEISD